jgi:hypothetical protein
MIMQVPAAARVTATADAVGFGRKGGSRGARP